MADLRRRARAADDPRLVREIAAVLESWEPCSRVAAPDGNSTGEAHARAVLAILAAGGSSAEVMGYLRRGEEDLFGAPRLTGEQRWELVQSIVRTVRTMEGCPTV